MNNTFSIRESFSFAWNVFTKRPWFLIGVMFATFVVFALISKVFPTDQGGNIVFTLVNLVIGIFIDMALIAFALAAHENVHTVTWKSVWMPQLFWKYLGASILMGIIVVVGLVLLVIPGLIAAFGFMFTKYLVVDRKLGPVEALKESWRITKGHKLHLLGFGFVAIVFNLIGAIAIGIGLLVTVPLTMLASAHIYRTLEHEAHEVAAPIVTA